MKSQRTVLTAGVKQYTELVLVHDQNVNKAILELEKKGCKVSEIHPTAYRTFHDVTTATTGLVYDLSPE